MTRDDTSLRDAMHELLIRLSGAEPTPSAAFRHFSIAALNLAVEDGAGALLQAGKALPWAAVYVQWEQGHSIEELAQTICAHGLIRHLSPAMILRRLSCDDDGPDSRISRSPAGLSQNKSVRARHERLLLLQKLDADLERLLTLDVHRRLDALVSDTALLTAALEICRASPKSVAARAFSEVLPAWELGDAWPGLDLLARFEATGFERPPVEFSRLSERSCRFEQSLAEHLKTHGLLVALRVALAFGPPRSAAIPPTRELQAFLARFSPFAEEPTLQQLTIALFATRWQAAEFLVGALPLEGLSAWVIYLRGACAEFAEARQITLREATNYAHYCFHLTNLCDLASRADVELTESLRRSLLDLEEELKEFALIGQRAGLTDRQSDLHRYEQTRWRSKGPRSCFADRLARLCGAWRQGRRPGPPGSVARQEGPLAEHCQALLADPENALLDAVTNLSERAILRHHHWLAAWSPEDVLTLLIVSLTAAENAPRIDTSEPFVVDFAPLHHWLCQDSFEQRSEMLRTLLKRQPLQFSGSTGELCGLLASEEEQHLQLHFSPHPELEAILTLLANGHDDDPLSIVLSERLDEICRPDQPKSQDEPQDEPTVDKETHSPDYDGPGRDDSDDSFRLAGG